MKIKEIEYGAKISFGEFNNANLSIRIEIGDGENVPFAMKELQRLVHRKLAEVKAADRAGRMIPELTLARKNEFVQVDNRDDDDNLPF